MSDFYLDTSAIVKRYVPEVGSSWVRQICDPSTGNHVCTSAITKVEFASAVCRRCREGHVTVMDRDSLINGFLAHCAGQYGVVNVTAAQLSLAMDVMKRQPLRAYDAMQLAAAIALSTSLTAASLPPLTFLSADSQLVTAAAAEGLNTDDPNAHP